MGDGVAAEGLVGTGCTGLPRTRLLRRRSEPKRASGTRMIGVALQYSRSSSWSFSSALKRYTNRRRLGRSKPRRIAP
jgi:hypothetical protein